LGAIVAVRCKGELKVLEALREHSNAKIVVRGQILQAERVHILHVLSICYSQWSSFVEKRALKLQMIMKACKMWTHNLQKSTLSRWKKTILLDQAEDPNAANHVDNSDCEELVLQRQKLIKCFWCWYLLVSQKSKWLTERWMQISDLLL
jgi:hypothetical protein